MHSDVYLTAREKEVYELILQGLTVQAIADKLFIAWSTANGLVGNIMNKYDIHSRLKLCALKITEQKEHITELENQIKELQCA